MAEPGARARTRITVPRVDFDLGAIAVGAIGWFAYELVWRLLAPALGIAERYDVLVPFNATQARPAQLDGFDALRREFFQRMFEMVPLPHLDALLHAIGVDSQILLAPTVEGQPAQQFRLGPDAFGTWQFAVVAAVLFLLWSIVGGALARMHAVRIARDESLPWDEGYAFAFANLRSFVGAPAFVAVVALLLFGATALAGLASTAPAVGPALQAVLQPLAFVSGLFFTILLAGGVFGLPILHAAVATERNGLLDAVSRLYSYVFTRPVAFVAGGVLVFAFGGLLAQFADWFTKLATIDIMNFGAQRDVATQRGLAIGYAAARQFGLPRVPEGSPPISDAAMWVSFAWSALVNLLVRGFVLSYVVGGFTDLYSHLREEVDGTPRSEVYLGDEPAPELGEPLAGEPAAPDPAA